MSFPAISSMLSHHDISPSESKQLPLPQRWSHPPTPGAEYLEMRTTPCPPSTTSEPNKTLAISNLMSPPGPLPFENFRDRHQDPTAGERQHVKPPLSPPVSPPNKPASTVEQASPMSSSHLDLQDPPLYPPESNSATASTKPLFIHPAVESFGTIHAAAAKRLVDQHIASRPVHLFRGATPPKPEEYELALYFKSNCFGILAQNPVAYLRKERELLRADRKPMGMSRPLHRLPPILPASRMAAQKQPAQVPRLAPMTAGSRIQKPKSSTIKVQVPRPIRATPAMSRPAHRISSTPEPRTRTVPSTREDKDFNALPDRCPPLSSLPVKPNSVKVDWKGAPLDLSKDPHSHLLHPDELAWAASLRLDCATYLTSKRRIFIRRLECAKIHKEFRKTDAQQACKIDVNKASKLWGVYNKVGWLEQKWMSGYL